MSDRTTYRQYIGARYVPKFFENSATGDSTWAEGTMYEPLTVVLWNNVSYTSKKAVPANIGAPNLNSDYWVATSNYNAIVGGLSDRVDALETHDVTTDSRVTNAFENIDRLNKIKKSYPKYRRFVFIGDSYETIIPGYKWSSICADILGVTSAAYVAAGGYGFVANGNTWLNLLTNATIEHENEVTDIVICGGTNDINENAAIVAQAMGTFDTYVKQRFVNLQQIHLGYIGYSHYSQTARRLHRTCFETYLGGAKTLGWHYLNGVENTLKDPRLILTSVSDLSHPNQSGVIALGENIAQAINTGSCTILKEINSTYSPNTSVVTGDTVSVQQFLYDHTLEIMFPDVTLTAATDISNYKTILNCTNVAGLAGSYKYWHTMVSWVGHCEPAIITTLASTTELTLWLRGGVTIPSGTSFTIAAFDVTCAAC